MEGIFEGLSFVLFFMGVVQFASIWFALYATFSTKNKKIPEWAKIKAAKVVKRASAQTLIGGITLILEILIWGI